MPQALGRLGAEVGVVMPRYRGLSGEPVEIAGNVRAHFIENDAFFDRKSLYGDAKGDYPDNLDRFLFFCAKALELAKSMRFQPDIVHAHDWHAALLPVLLKKKYARDPFFKKTKAVLTIHNLAYQGVFPRKGGSKKAADPLFRDPAFEFYGSINFLRAGILHSDALTTVSPTYAAEIQRVEYGCGLEKDIHKRAGRLKGILNGIDEVLWNPATDEKIAKQYTAGQFEGKLACKEDLQKRCKLPREASVPLFGIVARLAHQKGFDDLMAVADEMLRENLQLVLLGEGDPKYHRFFEKLQKKFPKKVSAHLGFYAAEAHQIYAGSDFFLMPSLFEPCGLGQMIGMRYGALPIVRRTGGLADTVKDIDEARSRGNGIVFDAKAPKGLLRAVRRALKLYEEEKRLNAVRRRALKADFSWDKSAKAYHQFFEEVLSL